jgi:segregation and condensation protein A
MENKVAIHIDNFEGPFDLLYYLIQKDKLDIYDIPITSITEQYLGFLFCEKNLDMEIASEFLVMASTLLHIKSMMLLPKYDTEEKEEDGIDSKEELIVRLIEYKKFRDVTFRLREMYETAQKTVYKYPENIHFNRLLQIGTYNVYELWNYLENMIESINTNVVNTREKMKMIKTREKVSVADKMKDIMNSLINKTRMIFSDIFKMELLSRIEIAAGFVAMLELSRLNRIKITQKALFDKIFISRKEKTTDEP